MISTFSVSFHHCRTGETKAYQIANDCQSVIENLDSWSDLEVFSNSFVEREQGCL
jgi:hypothetical protein